MCELSVVQDRPLGPVRPLCPWTSCSSTKCGVGQHLSSQAGSAEPQADFGKTEVTKEQLGTADKQILLSRFIHRPAGSCNTDVESFAIMRPAWKLTECMLLSSLR